jgi:hypothetical protein
MLPLAAFAFYLLPAQYALLLVFGIRGRGTRMGWYAVQIAIFFGIWYWAENHTWPQGKPSSLAIGVISLFFAYAVTFIGGLFIDGFRRLLGLRRPRHRIERQ